MTAPFVAGQKLRATDLNGVPGLAVLGGWKRNAAANLTGLSATTETDLGATTTTPALTFLGGHTYSFRLALAGQGSVANDVFYFYLRLNNPVGGAGSVIIPNSGSSYGTHKVLNGGAVDDNPFVYEWVADIPGTTVTSVYTSYKRGSGTGAFVVYGQGCSLVVTDCGVTGSKWTSN